MAKKRIDNATFILPLILGVALVGILVQYGILAAWMETLAYITLGATIPFLIGYLFVRQSGWRDLARKYPADPALAGEWKTCRTAILSTEGLDSPDYKSHKVVLIFIVRIDADDQALYVSAKWFFSLLLPPMRIPWSAIARVKYFDPSGWSNYNPQPGFLFQLNYDPGYKEQFVEIQVAEPTTFLQLPVGLLKDAIGHFPA
jgi:hypothetical protein